MYIDSITVVAAIKAEKRLRHVYIESITVILKFLFVIPVIYCLTTNHFNNHFK